MKMLKKNYRFLAWIFLFSLGLNISSVYATDYTIALTSTSPVAEGGAGVFTVTLTNGQVVAGETVEVFWETENDTAISPDDFLAASGSLVFYEGDQVENISISVLADGLVENDESFKVKITSVVGTGGAAFPGLLPITESLTITSADSAEVSLSGEKTSAAEGNSLQYRVILNKPVATDVTVEYVLAGSGGVDPAEAGDLPPPGSVTIPAGDSSALFSLVLPDDLNVENAEELTVTLDQINPAVNNVSLGASKTATGIIQNDDIATLSINNPLPVLENGGPLTFHVTSNLTVEAPAKISFTVRTDQGTAYPITDYTNINNVVYEITAGDTAAIDVAINDDAHVEGIETFTTKIVSSSANATIADSEGLGTITDNDSAVLSIANITVIEETGVARFTVQSTPSVTIEESAGVGFEYVTSDVTAVAPGDYTDASDTVSMPNSSFVYIDIPVINDNRVEDSETFKVTLSNLVGSGVSFPGNAPTVVAEATITNNDSVSVFINDKTVAEDGGSVTFTVGLSAAIDAVAGLSVDYTTSDGHAIAGQDYTSVNGTLNFPGGTTTLPIDVPILEDALVENSEIFKVQLSNLVGSPASFSKNEGVGTIADNDTATLSLVGVTTSGVEGATLTYRVEMNAVVPWDITVNYTVAGSGIDPAETTDYTTAGSVIVLAGNTSAEFTVSLTDDNIVEQDEEFTVTLSSSTHPASVTLGGAISEAGTIVNNDSATIALLADTTTAHEGESLKYSIELSSPVEWDVDVGYIVSGAGFDAAEATDYTSTSSVTVPGGDTSVSLYLPLIADNIVENTEEFTVTLNGFIPVVSLNLSSQTVASGKILDIDEAKISIDDVSVAEDSGLAIFSVTSAKMVSPTVFLQFNYQTVDGTALDGADYTSVSGAETLTNGDTVTLSVPILADNDTVEPDETFTLVLSNLSLSAGGDAQFSFVKDTGVGTITNDDILITLTEISPFGSVVETTAFAVPSSSGDANSLVVPLGSSPVFVINADPCPASLSHNGQVHQIADVLIDGVPEVGAELQSTYTYTFSNISTDHSLEALFTSLVDFTVHPNGHIETASGNVYPGTPGSIAIKANDTLAVTAVPDPGFYISQVLVDGVDVGTPEVYSFENWVDADATYEITFALTSFTLTPVSTYSTVFNDSAETVSATEKIVNYGQSDSFFVNLNDSSYAVYGILVDNISYAIPSSGVTVNYTGFSLTNTGDDYLEVRFISVNANHRVEVQDYDTSPTSDTPLDAKLRPKPASIMFVLDDSGSMDWEITTTGSEGLFNGDYYVYSYPATDRARVYDNNSLEYHNDHDEWRSQFFAVNMMFYNPAVTYVPWPTFTGTPTSQLPAAATDGLAHANMYRPRLHPWYSQDCTDAINLANGVATADLNNCDNSTQDTHNFPMDDIFLEFEDNSNAIIVDNVDSGFSQSGNWGSYQSWGDMWGSNYSYALYDTHDRTASWEFHPSTSGKYKIFVRWVATWERKSIPYSLSSTNFSGYVKNFDQRINGGKWNELGEFTLISGESVVVSMKNTSDFKSSACADAVKIVPESDTIRIINAHYYTWDDADGDGKVAYVDSNSNGQLDPAETISEDVYLVNLTKPIEYYKVISNSQPVSGSNLQKIANTAVPSTVKTYASPTASDTWQQERQNWADWFSYYRKRTLAATGAVARVIDLMEEVEVGIRTINYSSSYGISQSVLPVNVYGKEDKTNVLLEKLYSFQVDSYGTPLRRGLESVGKYYDDTDSDTGGIGVSPYNAKEDGDECKQVFAVLMTDGYWNGSNPGSAVNEADKHSGPPYADDYSPTLADVAMYYFNKDLSSLEDLVPDGIHNHQHMVTYTVSFGVYGSLNPSNFDLINGPYPSWTNPWSANSHKIDDMWHAAVNGRGKYMSASRPDELVDSLLDIMNDIGTRVGSGASVSVNGDEMYESVSGQIRMFQTTYNSGDWHGDLKSYKVDATTGEVVTSAPVWSAEEQLASKLTSTGSGHVNRIIATYSGGAGIPFRWGNLTNMQKDQLFPYFIESTSTTLTGEDVLEYLRGAKAYETSDPSGEFRERDAAHPLGDMIHSLARYEDDVLYVGANDGMLHAFLATDTGVGQEIFAYVPNLVFSQLRELADPAYGHLFYVDNTPDTQKMGSTTYLVSGLGKGGKGYFCLDITGVLSTSTSRASTVTSETDLASRVKWEFPAIPATLLSGNTFTFSSGTGTGGNDVIVDSNSGFSNALFSVGQMISVIGANYANGMVSGTNDGQYKITSIDPSGGYIEIESGSLITGYGDGKNITITEAINDPHLGYSFSKAYFVRTNDTSIGTGDLKGWVVIFGNGYGSENGTASLYIVNPASGALIKRIDTNVGPFNGLSTPNAIDVNNDLRTDYIYAGDLLGNMWKFDLTSSSSSNWQVAFCDGGDASDHCLESVSGMIPKPLFAGLANQAITGAPDITRHQTGQGYMVIFGTGKYIGEPDLTSRQVQSLYGIWDWAPDALDSGYHGARVDVGATNPKTSTLSNWPETNVLGDATHTLLKQEVWDEATITEDTNGNGSLDAGEDVNDNSVLDTYSYYRIISNYSGDWTLEKTNNLVAGHHLRNVDVNGDGSVNSKDLVPAFNVGWVFDLPGKIDVVGDGIDNDLDGTIDEAGERILGERVVNDTIIRDGKAIMLSFGVTGTRCNAGAYSFLNERDANTGGMTSTPVYDLNGDGEVDADDGVIIQVNVDINNDGFIDANDVIMAYPSDAAYDGRLYNPAILRESDTADRNPEEKKYFSTSQGSIIVVDEKAERRGFSYWQQME